jgi:hypothetical protein
MAEDRARLPCVRKTRQDRDLSWIASGDEVDRLSRNRPEAKEIAHAHRPQ